MQRLTNKRILLGVTGGIAAYKAAELVRAYKTAGADVRVVMTQAAQEFITPLTLQALSGNPVHYSMLDPEAEAGMGHIELAKWADVVVIAPSSADFIARASQGMGNDLLTTLCLATDAPLLIAPAMNQAMWRDETTQRNIEQLKAMPAKEVHWVGPDQGQQACGDIGPGRLVDPEFIAQATANLFDPEKLQGKKIVITAGPTQEAIDPVRYISNHSSGKMGFAIAQKAIEAGAQVTLIAGPVHLPTPDRVKRVNVVSAVDMLEAAHQACEDADVFIGAAAVADYRPKKVADQKMKKQGSDLTLQLEQNPDIIATVSKDFPQCFMVGFAAETQQLNTYAQEKLERKGLDMIVANDVSQPNIGFNSDDNAALILSQTTQIFVEQTSKAKLADKIISMIHQHINQ